MAETFREECTSRNPRTAIDCHYVDQGSGAPLILMHGLAGNHTRWAAAASLLSRNYRTITYDLRGHGLSGKAPVLDYSFDAHVEDLAGLMDALGIRRATLAGHSMGGMIAQYFALKYPERVERLVLVATSACLAPGAFRRVLLWILTNILILLPAALAFFARRQTRGKPHELFPEKDDPALDFIPKSLAKCFQAIMSMDTRKLVPHIHIPTLVISSSIDNLIAPRKVKELSEMILGSRFVTVENQGHFVPVEQPEQTAATITHFLNESMAEENS